MAWPVPLDPGDWIGTAWSPVAFVNAMLTGAALRATAVSQAGGGGAVTADLLEAGANLQSAGQINLLRPRDTVPVATHVLTLAGGYGTDYAGTAAADLAGSARWVDPSVLAVGQAFVEADRALWTPGDGFTQAFVDLVNAKLDEWVLDPMGTSPISGGIPWTRKSGDAGAPDLDHGPMEVGDIFGEWIFNEWRAVLEVLNAIAVTPSFSVPETYIWWEGNASGETDCAAAKSAVTSDWHDTSPVTPPGQVSATGFLQHDPGEGDSGDMTRTWLEYAISNCSGVDHGTFYIFIHARKFGDAFNDFGDGTWEEDMIGQIEDTTTAPYTFSPSPFDHTDDEDILDVSCPVHDDPNVVSRSEGYTLDEAPGMVVYLDFPAP